MELESWGAVISATAETPQESWQVDAHPVDRR